MPRALASRPDLYPDLAPYLGAYNTLARSRGGEMVPARITVEAVAAYARESGLDFENLLVATQQLDDIVLADWKAREDAKREAAEAAQRRAPRRKKQQQSPDLED